MRSVLHFIIATTLITKLYGVELTTEQELKLLNYKRKISPSSRVKYQRLMRYMAKVRAGVVQLRRQREYQMRI